MVPLPPTAGSPPQGDLQQLIFASAFYKMQGETMLDTLMVSIMQRVVRHAALLSACLFTTYEPDFMDVTAH